MKSSGGYGSGVAEKQQGSWRMWDEQLREHVGDEVREVGEGQVTIDLLRGRQCPSLLKSVAFIPPD